MQMRTDLGTTRESRVYQGADLNTNYIFFFRQKNDFRAQHLCRSIKM